MCIVRSDGQYEIFKPLSLHIRYRCEKKMCNCWWHCFASHNQAMKRRIIAAHTHPNRRRSNRRLQLTAFGARDRCYFSAIWWSAPRQQLKRNTLGQKPDHAYEPTIVFSRVQARDAQSTHSNAISLNAYLRLRAWQSGQKQRIPAPMQATPSKAISE